MFWLQATRALHHEVDARQAFGGVAFGNALGKLALAPCVE